jgi:hypothetical protein
VLKIEIDVQITVDLTVQVDVQLELYLSITTGFGSTVILQAVLYFFGLDEKFMLCKLQQVID